MGQSHQYCPLSTSTCSVRAPSNWSVGLKTNAPSMLTLIVRFLTPSRSVSTSWSHLPASMRMLCLLRCSSLSARSLACLVAVRTASAATSLSTIGSFCSRVCSAAAPVPDSENKAVLRASGTPVRPSRARRHGRTQSRAGTLRRAGSSGSRPVVSELVRAQPTPRSSRRTPIHSRASCVPPPPTR